MFFSFEIVCFIRSVLLLKTILLKATRFEVVVFLFIFSQRITATVLLSWTELIHVTGAARSCDIDETTSFERITVSDQICEDLE